MSLSPNTIPAFVTILYFREDGAWHWLELQKWESKEDIHYILESDLGENDLLHLNTYKTLANDEDTNDWEMIEIARARFIKEEKKLAKWNKKRQEELAAEKLDGDDIPF